MNLKVAGNQLRDLYEFVETIKFLQASELIIKIVENCTVCSCVLFRRQKNLELTA